MQEGRRTWVDTMGWGVRTFSKSLQHIEEQSNTCPYGALYTNVNSSNFMSSFHRSPSTVLSPWTNAGVTIL